MMAIESPLSVTRRLDNRGSDCAAGFVKLLEIIESLSAGETLLILSTDAASWRELEDWAARAGHTMLDATKSGPFWRREYHYLIRKEAV